MRVQRAQNTTTPSQQQAGGCLRKGGGGMSWYTSDRRERLPKDWDTIRTQVKRRAGGRCEAKVHARGCDGVGTDCDHITPGDDHSLENLQLLSHCCHVKKTQAEAAERNHAWASMGRRPSEKHPGSFSA